MTSKGRVTVFTHADGTVSTRSSNTRVYGWAVEIKEDRHAWARAELADLPNEEALLNAFERAADDGERAAEHQAWQSGADHVDFYIIDPETERSFWIGSEIRHADGTITRPFDESAEIDKMYAHKSAHLARRREAALEALNGPQYRYGIARWSERRDSAEKALTTFGDRAHSFVRVVEVQSS
jgi:hypothetical protein